MIWRTSGRSLDLEQNTRVVRDGDRVVGYGAVRDRGELWRAEGYVHPDAHGRGIGKLLATAFERDAVCRGARRIQNGVYEADAAACSLLESIGYRAVRVFREMRIELDAPPPLPIWPDGLHVVAFDPERDALAFHAAQQEAFADHWEYTPRDFESWSKSHLMSERFDPALWCVVKAGDEIAAGTICTRGHLRRRLRPDPLHASAVAQARHRRGAPRGRVPQALGAWRAQRRARRRRGERHRSVSPLRACRNDARASAG